MRHWLSNDRVTIERVAKRMRTLTIRGKYWDRYWIESKGACEVYERADRRSKVMVQIWDLRDGTSRLQIHSR